MPLYRKKEHMLAETPTGLGPNDKVWVVRQTREVFTDFATYQEKQQLYESAVWSCKRWRRKLWKARLYSVRIPARQARQAVPQQVAQQQETQRLGLSSRCSNVPTVEASAPSTLQLSMDTQLSCGFWSPSATWIHPF